MGIVRILTTIAALGVFAQLALAAPLGRVYSDRIANAKDDYVFVIADTATGLGAAPYSRETIQALLQMGVDGFAFHVRKDADGAIRVSDELALQDAVRLVRGKSLFFASGFESFPQEFYDTFCKAGGDKCELVFNSTKPMLDFRAKTMKGGLDDSVVNFIHRHFILLTPTVSATLQNFDAAPDIHYLRLCEVQLAEGEDDATIKRFKGYNCGVNLMFDTTSDAFSGGHGDARAVLDPEAHWGWCLAQGARAIRTTRPAELLLYLTRKGRHDFSRHAPVTPYAAAGGAEVTLTPALVPAPREMTVGKGLVPISAKVVRTTDATLPPEGYALTIDKERGVKVASADADGAFWAEQTLLQLKGTVNGEEVYPVVSIRDWPEFRWRGALMDDSRHFIGKEGVKLFLDAMAKHKLNVFHWHPDDDQGWRLPLAGFPDLQLYGSTLKKRNGKLYGPFAYTAEEVREILAYAKARHIKVVPEFEIPGHNRALVCSYPEISCVSSRPQKCIPRDGSCFDNGVEPNSICAGDDAAIATVERMLDALMALFPDSDTIHIGGDEVNYNWWKKCPNCQARIKKLGLKDEKALQSWLVRHFVAYLAKHGRKAIGWDEVVDGGIPENFQVMYWRGGGYQSHRIAATNGTGVVMCPSSHCYFDKDALLPNDKYAGFGACTMRNAYSFDPYAGIPTDRRDCVMGTQGLLWGEMIASADELIWKAYPRLCVTAEIGWTNPPLPRDYDGFLKRLGTHIPRLRSWGIGSAFTQELIPSPDTP